jgi:hypothetical protein
MKQMLGRLDASSPAVPAASMETSLIPVDAREHDRGVVGIELADLVVGQLARIHHVAYVDRGLSRLGWGFRSSRLRGLRFCRFLGSRGRFGRGRLGGLDFLGRSGGSAAGGEGRTGRHGAHHLQHRAPRNLPLIQRIHVLVLLIEAITNG